MLVMVHRFLARESGRMLVSFTMIGNAGGETVWGKVVRDD